MKIGEQIRWRTPDGVSRLYTLGEISNGMATLDANHPLAGQDLVFDIEAVDARDATKDEIAESNAPSGRRALH